MNRDKFLRNIRRYARSAMLALNAFNTPRYAKRLHVECLRWERCAAMSRAIATQVRDPRLP